MRVLILGGAGFIGRHACTALLKRGHVVVIGSRHARSSDPRLPPTLQSLQRRRVRVERMTTAAQWDALLDGVDAVLNCVGILRPRWRESYDAVHHRSVAALAQATQARGLRLLHVSALGLRGDARSRFIRSKWQGEQALLGARGDITIVRPSLLDGADGFGARWLRRLARWPLHCVPADAAGQIAPLDVDDLGTALAALCEAPTANQRIVELGGADTRSMAEHLAALRRQHTAPPARVLRVPTSIARLASHLCDVLHVTPFSFGHLELMRAENVPRINALPALLGRAPRWIGVREGRVSSSLAPGAAVRCP
jgi:NADH dehydrogenase